MSGRCPTRPQRPLARKGGGGLEPPADPAPRAATPLAGCSAPRSGAADGPRGAFVWLRTVAWAGLAAASAAFDTLPASHRWDARLSARLGAQPWAHGHLTGVLWSAGGPLAALAAFLVVTATQAAGPRRFLGAWAAFAATAALELLLKHLGVGGRTAGVPIYLVRYAHGDIAAAQAMANALLGHLGLHGAFPSGHVLRLTLIAGFATPPGRRTLPLVVAAAACLVAAGIGGHTLAQGVGGGALALAALAVVRGVGTG